MLGKLLQYFNCRWTLFKTYFFFFCVGCQGQSCIDGWVGGTWFNRVLRVVRTRRLIFNYFLTKIVFKLGHDCANSAIQFGLIKFVKCNFCTCKSNSLNQFFYVHPQKLFFIETLWHIVLLEDQGVCGLWFQPRLVSENRGSLFHFLLWQ